jgi:hypothetical protein
LFFRNRLVTNAAHSGQIALASQNFFSEPEPIARPIAHMQVKTKSETHQRGIGQRIGNTVRLEAKIGEGSAICPDCAAFSANPLSKPANSDSARRFVFPQSPGHECGAIWTDCATLR